MDLYIHNYHDCGARVKLILELRLRSEGLYGRVEKTIRCDPASLIPIVAARLRMCGLARRLCDMARPNKEFMPSHIKNPPSSHRTLHCRPGMQVAFNCGALYFDGL
jgi:hypothetical protein